MHEGGRAEATGALGSSPASAQAGELEDGHLVDEEEGSAHPGAARIRDCRSGRQARDEGKPGGCAPPARRVRCEV